LLDGGNVTLEIYLDVNGEAEGEVYFDDGKSFEYRDDCQRTLIKYTFTNKTLYATNPIDDGCGWNGAADTVILFIYIYGPENAKL